MRARTPTLLLPLSGGGKRKRLALRSAPERGKHGRFILPSMKAAEKRRRFVLPAATARGKRRRFVLPPPERGRVGVGVTSISTRSYPDCLTLCRASRWTASPNPIGKAQGRFHGGGRAKRCTSQSGAGRAGGRARDTLTGGRPVRAVAANRAPRFVQRRGRAGHQRARYP